MARAPQLSGDLFGLDLLPQPHRLGQGIYFGGVAEDGRSETPLDDPVVLDVVVRKDRRKADRKNHKSDKRCPKHRIARQAADSLPLRPVSTFWDLDLDAHGYRLLPAPWSRFEERCQSWVPPVVLLFPTFSTFIPVRCTTGTSC